MAEKKELIINEKTLPILMMFAGNLPGGLFIYKVNDEELIYFNDAMHKAFECESDEEFKEYVQNSFKGIVYKDDYEQAKKEIDLQINESIDKLNHVTYRIVTKKGNIRWFDNYGRFVSTEEYGDVYFVFVKDITESKKLENESKLLVAKQSQLVHLVDSRFNINSQNNTLEGLNILVVDDEEFIRDMNKEILTSEGANVKECIDGLQAVDLIANGESFDLILMDLVMPNLDGICAIKKIRELEVNDDVHIPIVALTATIDDTKISESILAGADDCIKKPLNVAELSRILIACMKEQSIKMEKKLKNTLRMATTDPLTHVKNITAFTGKVDELTRKMQNENNIKFAVLMNDINHLKKINDRHGHDAGDNYIKNCCRIICDIFVHSPVYRIGGDEFVVILEGSDYLNRDKLIRKLNSQKKAAENTRGIENGFVSFSTGMAVYSPRIDFTVSDVVKRADIEMYKVKPNSR